MALKNLILSVSTRMPHVLLLAAVFSMPAVAATVDSHNILSGSWFLSKTWSPQVIPNNTPGTIYNVRIVNTNTSGVDVTLDGDATINSLFVEGRASLYLQPARTLRVNTDISGTVDLPGNPDGFILTDTGSKITSYGNLRNIIHNAPSATTYGTLENIGGTVGNIINNAGSLALNNSTLDGRITNNANLVLEGTSSVFSTATISGTGNIQGGSTALSYLAADASSTLTFEGDQTLDGVFLGTINGQVVINGALRTSNGGTADLISDVSGTGVIHTTSNHTIVTRRVLEGVTHSGAGILFNDGGTVRNITNSAGFLTLNNSTLDGRITNNDALVVGGSAGTFTTALIDGTGSILDGGAGVSYDAANAASTLTFNGDQTIDGAFLGTTGGQVIIDGALRTVNNGTADFFSDVGGVGSIHTESGASVRTHRVLEGVNHFGSGILLNDGGTVRNITNHSGFLTLINSTLDGRIVNKDALVVDGTTGTFTTALIDGTGRILGGGAGASFDAAGAAATLTFDGDQTIDGVSFGTTDGQVIIDGALRAVNNGTADFFSDVSGVGSVHTVTGASIRTHRVLEGVSHFGTGILLNDGGTVRNITNHSGFLTLNNSTLDGRITNNDALVIGGSAGSFTTALIEGTGSVLGGVTGGAYNAAGPGSTLMFAGDQNIDGAFLGTTGGQVIINGILRTSNGGTADFVSDVSGTGSVRTGSGASVMTHGILEGVAHLGSGILLNDGGTVRNLTNISGFLALNNSTLDGRITNHDRLDLGGSSGSFTTALIEGTGSIIGGGGSAGYTAAGAGSTLMFGGDQTIDGTALGTTGGQVIVNGVLRTANGGSADLDSDVSGSGSIHNGAGTAIVTRRLLADITHTATGSGTLVNDGGTVRDVTNASGVLGLVNSQLQGQVINNAIIATGSPAIHVDVSKGAILTNNGVIQADVRIESNGVLSGTGLVDGNLVNDGGILAPGLSPGSSQVAGDYTQTLNGIFSVEIGGYLQGVDYDWLDVSAGALLGGILDVSLFDFGAGLFQPKLGDTFDILSAKTIAGEFDRLSSVALGRGLRWDVGYIHDDFGSDFVRLTVATVPVPGAVWLFASGLMGLMTLARRR